MTTKKRRIRCAAPSRRQYVVEQYLKEKTEYELEAAKAQTKSWKEFCGTQNRESFWDGIYRVIRKTSKLYEDQPLTRNGTVLSPAESAELLSETFFPDDLVENDNSYHTIIRLTAEKSTEKSDLDTITDQSFTISEIMHSASSFNPRKAPGADGFTADICLAAIQVDPLAFLGIVNACLRLSYFPTAWKRATVIVLRKPGKVDYSHPKSYRPIGLLPVFGKILEKAMVRRLRWHLLPKLNPKQYGFVPQRCTEDALYDLIQHIRENLKKKKINVVVSLDIEGAFDSAWWPAIKCRLTEMNCPLYLRKLVKSYLKDRTVCIRYAGEECVKSTTKGCVQGSISGPTLWNVLLDPLLNEISAREVHCQAFADDIVLVISGNEIGKIEEKAEQVLRRVYEWGIENKLKFAPHKTQGMIITKKIKYDVPHIYMGNAQIQFVKEIKILGLTIDSKLNFNSHVKEVCRKAINIYKPMARSAKINWGLNPQIIRTMYKAVIEPIILYAASAWAPAAEKITVQKQFGSVQRGFAQKICKAYRTVSLHAALILTGILPLHLRVKEAAELYEAKRGRQQDILAGDEMEGKVSYVYAIHPAKEEHIQFECLEDLEKKTIDKHNIHGVLIFTDGSKIEEKVGASFSCWKGDREILAKKFRLSAFCTVFQAEMYAIYQASITANKLAEENISILSDSRSALDLLCNHGASHPLAFSTKENLRLSKENGKKVRMFWIRAHAGVQGNERADELAKQAAKNKKSAPDYDKCPLSYIKRDLRSKSINEWDTIYTKSDRAKTTKLFLPDVKTAHHWRKNNDLTPMLVQVLTGHGGFSEYLYKYRCKDSPACACDEETGESIIHLLIDCPIFSRFRYDIEQLTGYKISVDNLPALISDQNINQRFIEFSMKLTRYAIKRNATK